MIKIAALNKELEEESRSEEEVTREALEQIALQNYSKALELHRKGKVQEATQLLKALLDTELLDGVKKPGPGEKVVGPLYNLKYLCYKNLASIVNISGDLEAAIQYYEAAAELDDTDITLWHRLGMLCMRAKQYEKALYSFQRGFERNPRHWPCRDKIITLLLGLDYKKECIAVIYESLQMDSGYLRGIVYRKHIYTHYPHIKIFMESLNPMYKWTEADDEIFSACLKKYSSEKIAALLEEAEEIHKVFLEQQRAEQYRTIVPHLKLRKPISRFTWASVGESLVHMHKYMTDNYFSHACPIKIVVELAESPSEGSEEVNESECGENRAEESPPAKTCGDGDNNDVAEKDKTSGDTEKPIEKVESDVEMVAAEPVAESGGAKKKAAARRRGSALSFLQQWEWCNKRRSGRKKPDNKQELDDNIYDTLRRMVPAYLSPETIRNEEEEARKKQQVNDLTVQQEQKTEEQQHNTTTQEVQSSPHVTDTSETVQLTSEVASHNVEQDIQNRKTLEQKSKEDLCGFEPVQPNLEQVQKKSAQLQEKTDEVRNNLEIEMPTQESLQLHYNAAKNKEQDNLEYYTKTFKYRKRKKCVSKPKDLDVIPEKSADTDFTEVTEDYFKSENEQKEVKEFIEYYTANKKDIIDLLQDYLYILAKKWNVKWPEGLPVIFIAANECYTQHIDIPACTDDNLQGLLHYTAVNLLAEEFMVNEKLNSTAGDNKTHGLSVAEYIKLILSFKPHIFRSLTLLEFMLRQLWLHLHIYVLNKSEELALDCLYQLVYEYESMGDSKEAYCLEIVNFIFKPRISRLEIYNYIKFLERNKKLATVMDLHESGHHDDVLCILMDSFEHYKEVGKKQEDEMSLDFAVQLMLILDTLWALDKVELCFKWSLICLHEALAHYFRFTSGSSDYAKWSVAVVKIVSCMEHILTTEGLMCLETISRKELSQGVEDLIRVIGHQVETNGAEMPFQTVSPWIIIHYILQREEDQGRAGPGKSEEVPGPLMLLFIAHEQLGNRSWCCENKGKLIYFILDTVVPRLRSPSLSKCLEQICQYMEQCVYCLYAHPSRKNKIKHLNDHNVTPHSLEWTRAQQLYEIFRPLTLPALEGKVSGITADTEQLFHRILALLPKECDPNKYFSDMEKYIKGGENKLPTVPPLLPFKMKDIYFLLGDYYFKKEEGKMAIKFNILDVIVNNDRLESWAEISLAKAVNLERLLNSCKNINNEREFLNPAKAIIRCFQRTLELDPSHCNMWIEYGMFVYTVHSFCSRLLKQASESLSMESFEALEKQKEDMLDTTHDCFMTVLNDSQKINKNRERSFGDDNDDDEDAWLHYYMLGKVAEKRNRPPAEYLDYYMQGVKSLQETDATYPLKINYSSPTHLCIEVLELHYRIHASILKYIEQHENKPIPASVGKVFSDCIEEWKKGPFTNKKSKKDGLVETDSKSKQTENIVHPANILKRSASDAGEDETPEAKRLKTESAAAKVKRSASYTDRTKKEPQPQRPPDAPETAKLAKDMSPSESIKTTPAPSISDVDIKIASDGKEAQEKVVVVDKSSAERNKSSVASTAAGVGSSSSSSSSSGSSSSESSSDSSSESSRDSAASTPAPTDLPLTEQQIMDIVHSCLDALEDCASRFPPHYKAIYRLAHYHFYYKKGKNIERCRDLMLSNFTSRAGQKLAGLFSERKHSNFFNNIWKIPLSEVDRAGGFAFHMSRSVLLTMEILKEIDDHKTLLDLSLHLQRIPEADKKYLRDSDREELAQQAFSLCVQSLKGQLLKFSQQEDLKSNDVERQALKSLMLDIYRAYQRVQKQPNSKQFTNLLIDAYKLVSTTPITENMNLVDLSMKYCQSLIQTLRQQATQASLDKSQHAHKKQSKAADTAKVNSVGSQAKVDPKPAPVPAAAAVPPPPSPASPIMTPQDLAASLQNFLPVLKDPMLTSQTAAAINYLNNISALAGYPPLQSPLQNTIQNTFQAEFYRQFISQSLASYNLAPPKPKQKRGPKPGSTRATNKSQPSQAKVGRPATAVTGIPIQKPTHTSSVPNYSKASTSASCFSKPSTSVSRLSKTSSAPLAPSMGTVLSSLPPSMSLNLSSFGGSSSLPTSGSISQAHTSSVSTLTSSTYTKPPLPHQPAKAGKTLQEKLAERQKIKPPIGQALSKLPSSVTITKTTVYKPPAPKKSQPFTEGTSRQGNGTHRQRPQDTAQRPKETAPRPKQLTEEIIVLDDD